MILLKSLNIPLTNNFNNNNNNSIYRPTGNVPTFFFFFRYQYFPHMVEYYCTAYRHKLYLF